MEKEKLLDFAKEFNLVVKLTYSLNKETNNFSAVIPGKTLNEVNKIISDSFELEIAFQSDTFKNLKMSEKNIAYELFCLYNIRHSQENEFFID